MGREQHTNAHAGGGSAHTIVGLLQPVCAAIRRADKRSSVHPKKGGQEKNKGSDREGDSLPIVTV